MPRKKLTTEDFIKKATEIHGEKYNYSKVEYINSKTKILIKCKKCNKEFEQTPNTHLQGHGCPKCKAIKHSIESRLTTEEFIKRSIKIHKEKYNYSKVEYISIFIKVIIFCKKCNKYFKQTPSAHLQGQGCPKCKAIKHSIESRLTTEEFIKKAKKIHGDKYNYSKVEYISSKTKVIIFCKKCNKYFKQIPNSHLQNRGCFKCTGKNKTTKELIEQFIKIHGDKYNYSKVEYISSKTKVIIFCKKCNKYFKQTPSAHLQGQGCSKCGEKTKANKCKLTIKEFIEKSIKVHKEKYDYSKVKYVNSKIKVIIICNKCNKEFKQIPNSHLKGHGCPFCIRVSENKVGNFLNEYFFTFKIISHKFIYKYIGIDKKKHKRYCDFYLQKKEKIIIVEYDGEQHFMPRRFGGKSQEKAEKAFKVQQFIDNKDTEFCNSNNILLWRIKYDDNKEKSILRLKELIND